MVTLHRVAPGHLAARTPRDAARSNLLTAGSIVASGIALSGLYAVAGVGLPCPFKLVTGWDCPLCGGTRMGSALLHLDLPAALAYNPLALLALLVVGMLSLGWLVQLVGDHQPRWLASTAVLARRVPVAVWWVGGTGLAVGYLVLRNLVWPVPA